ncbi:MAG: hypothetical protein V2A79_09765 [Planctomycetota bacterium]
MKRVFLFACLLALLRLPPALGETAHNLLNQYRFTGPYDLSAVPEILKSNANVFFVSSTAAEASDAADGWHGEGFQRPFATLDYAVGRCTASNNNVIVVAPYHAESFAAAGGVDVDVSGITIIGLGYGPARPKFTFTDTDGTFVVGRTGDGATLQNLTFEAGISAVVVGVQIEDGADNVTFIDCEWLDSATAAYEFLTAVDVVTEANDLAFLRCRWTSAAAAGATVAVDIGDGAVVGLRFEESIFYGDWATACVFSDQALTKVLVKGCDFYNANTDEFGIEAQGTGNLGMIRDCTFITSGNYVDTGGLGLMGNVYKTIGDGDTESQSVVATVGAGSIDAAAIATAAIDADAIAADAITTAEIANGAITATEIADAAIDAATFASAAIDATAIATDAIGAAELAANAIGASEIADDAIDAGAIAADAITSSEIADGAIDAGAIATNAIAAAEVADDAIDAGAIATDAIGAAEIAANAITASEIADDAIDAGAIAADAITSAEIANDAIGATEIANGAIDAATFASAAIAADAIATDAIGAAEIAANAITASEISAGATDEIADTVHATMDANSTIASNVTAILTDTAAMDSASELRTLLVGSNLELATEANLTAVLADTAAMDTAAELRTLLAGADLEIATEANLTAVLADTSAMDTAAELRTLLAGADLEIATEANLTLVKAVTDDLAGISQIGDKVQADMDVNSVLYWQPRVSTVAADEVTQDLFAVAGGPIEILSLTGHVDVLIGAVVTTCKIWSDATAGAAYDKDYSTAVAITDDAAGTTYVFTAANPSVLTPLTGGAAGGSTNFAKTWWCPIGMIEQEMSADPGGAVGDHITWYMVWRPLAAGVTVTAQ